MKQKRAYRYRFYPTPEQATVLARTFGSARFVYNWALRLRTDTYYQRQERIGYHEASAALTALKQQPVNVRQWTCPACGVHHDRDVNAARNVRAAGLAVNACGETVRPGRAMPNSAGSDEAGIPRL